KNLNYPRDRLSILYTVGGVVSFITVQTVGRLVDRFGSARVGAVGAAIFITTLCFGFISYPPGLPVLLLFVLFMLGMGFRNVAYNTLTSKVPRTGERARFMSIQSSVQHFSSAVGAFLSAHMLRESADQRLEGVDKIAWVSIGLTAVLPILLWRVERQVFRPDIAAAHAQPLELHSGVNSPGPGLPRPLQKT